MPPDSLTVRPLEAADAEASRTLGFEAFGMPTSPPTEPATLDRPGRTYHGVFAGDRLVGRLADRAYDSWFGGVPVPTCGVAGVTVAMEDRGRGALSPLFAAALIAARERGAVISGLYPTAARIYRRFGYELVSDYRTISIAHGPAGRGGRRRSGCRRVAPGWPTCRPSGRCTTPGLARRTVR